MQWMIVGGRGMLGQDLEKLLQAREEQVTVWDRPEIDITSAAGLEPLAQVLRAGDVVVNTAAFTQVDAAETDEATAFAINAVGSQNVARLAAAKGARLVQISTDYVMRGDGSSPYPEQSDLAPVGAYGRTKAAGEWAAQMNCPDTLIVRTAWLYGRYGNCFPKTMRRLAQTHPQLKVVTDEVGQPTWTVDLADLLYRLVKANAPAGIYHGTSQGETSWFEFTREIMQTLGKDPQIVQPTTAAAFQRPAPRPSYSALGHKSLRDCGIEPIGDWRQRWLAAAADVFAEE